MTLNLNYDQITQFSSSDVPPYCLSLNAPWTSRVENIYQFVTVPVQDNTRRVTNNNHINAKDLEARQHASATRSKQPVFGCEPGLRDSMSIHSVHDVHSFDVVWQSNWT